MTKELFNSASLDSLTPISRALLPDSWRNSPIKTLATVQVWSPTQKGDRSPWGAMWDGAQWPNLRPYEQITVRPGTKIRASTNVVIEYCPPKNLDNPLVAFLAAQNANSRKTQYFALKRLAVVLELPGNLAEIPWWEIPVSSYAWALSKMEEFSRSSVSLTKTALFGVLDWSCTVGLMPADARHSYGILRKKKTGVQNPPKGRALSLSELRMIFAHCDDTKFGTRTAAMFALMFGCGLRAREIRMLHLQDVDMENKIVRVKHGKGNKCRVLPFGGDGEAVTEYLQRYLNKRGSTEGQFFFLPMSHDHKRWIYDRHCSEMAIARAIKSIVELAGMSRFSAHDLRSTFATQLISQSQDLGAVQILMGHASIRTTTIYDRGKYQRANEVASGLVIPRMQPRKRGAVITEAPTRAEHRALRTLKRKKDRESDVVEGLRAGGACGSESGTKPDGGGNYGGGADC